MGIAGKPRGLTDNFMMQQVKSIEFEAQGQEAVTPNNWLRAWAMTLVGDVRRSPDDFLAMNQNSAGGYYSIQ